MVGRPGPFKTRVCLFGGVGGGQKAFRSKLPRSPRRDKGTSHLPLSSRVHGKIISTHPCSAHPDRSPKATPNCTVTAASDPGVIVEHPPPALDIGTALDLLLLPSGHPNPSCRPDVCACQHAGVPKAPCTKGRAGVPRTPTSSPQPWTRASSRENDVVRDDSHVEPPHLAVTECRCPLSSRGLSSVSVLPVPSPGSELRGLFYSHR